jgi:hypothetical protein
MDPPEEMDEQEGNEIPQATDAPEEMESPEPTDVPEEEAPEELELPENEEVTPPEELVNTPGENPKALTNVAEIDLNSWPEASRKAVEEVTGKYGEPDGVTEKELTWYDAGVWKRIRISSQETDHEFPIKHTDMLEMTIQYDVPEDKMDELGAFDGSITFDKTQGFMSARCDMEKNNFLALNLAHDIIEDKKTVEEARTAYAYAIKEMMNGGTPEYQQGLTFSPEPQAGDPGENTTGLTKKEVMKKMKKKDKPN